MSMRTPLDAEIIEEQLDEHLFAVLTSRRTARLPALGIADLPRPQQDFVLRWVKMIAPSSSEMAYQFAASAPLAFQSLREETLVAEWLIHAMDIFDRAGLYAAMEIIGDCQGFAHRLESRQAAVILEDISGVLSHFVQGLSGRPLKIAAGEETYTDTETLFLPQHACLFPTWEENFQCYKLWAVFLWAEVRFGTWQVSLAEGCGRFPDPERALGLFHALEIQRLAACIARELPGLFRDLQALLNARGTRLHPPDWESPVRRLQEPSARVQETLALLPLLYQAGTAVPAPLFFQGRLFPERVEKIRQERLLRERQELQRILLRLQEEQRAPAREEASEVLPEAPGEPPAAFTIRHPEPHQEKPFDLTLELFLGQQPLPVPEEVRSLLHSIVLDLGEIPDDYLLPAGEGAYAYRPGEPENGDPSADVWKGTYHEQGACLYDEWDFRRQHYRKAWCVLRELEVHPQPGVFVERTRRKYARHLVALRKSFEALRGVERRLKGEPIGDEVDIDALIAAYAETRRGLEATDRLFTRLHKVERDVAVMFMVDMSGSTKGWINDAERESLVLLCEALQMLGDRYAIYGFSGMTRKRCEVYRIKRFEDPYDEQVQARIAGILPKDYTRMGAAIRHLSRLLTGVEARTRLLVTLSDGKPDDYGVDYRGEYGIEDTRQALIEAKRSGIHPFCITIDREAAAYLPHMYGPVNYTIIDAVEKLPLRVSEIYRRLTK